MFGDTTKAAINYVVDEGSAGFDLALGSRVAIFIIGAFVFAYKNITYNVSKNSRVWYKRISKL